MRVCESAATKAKECNEFKSMTESQKIDYIKSLESTNKNRKIIELLTGVGVENLSVEFLGMLARAYNNYDQIEDAMKIMDIIPEDKRDARWYYRYGYSYAYKIFPNDSIDDNLKALELFEKAIEKGNDDEVTAWCVELVHFCNLFSLLEKNKLTKNLLYESYTSSQYMQSQNNTEKENISKTDDESNQLTGIDWVFDKHQYSKEEFETKFNEIMTDSKGERWLELLEPEILVTYEAWIENTNQLHENERLNECEELIEEDKEDDMWQVEIMAYLKADNNNFFTSQELLFKLQNLMANKELGDHVFFEGIEYEGHECEGNGLIDNENGIPVFHVICGS